MAELVSSVAISFGSRFCAGGSFASQGCARDSAHLQGSRCIAGAVTARRAINDHKLYRTPVADATIRFRGSFRSAQRLGARSGEISDDVQSAVTSAARDHVHYTSEYAG